MVDFEGISAQFVSVIRRLDPWGMVYVQASGPKVVPLASTLAERTTGVFKFEDHYYATCTPYIQGNCCSTMVTSIGSSIACRCALLRRHADFCYTSAATVSVQML